jgi:hypothetical protein
MHCFNIPHGRVIDSKPDLGVCLAIPYPFACSFYKCKMAVLMAGDPESSCDANLVDGEQALWGLHSTFQARQVHHTFPAWRTTLASAKFTSTNQSCPNSTSRPPVGGQFLTLEGCKHNLSTVEAGLYVGEDCERTLPIALNIDHCTSQTPNATISPQFRGSSEPQLATIPSRCFFGAENTVGWSG